MAYFPIAGHHAPSPNPMSGLDLRASVPRQTGAWNRGCTTLSEGRVAQLVRALLSHSRGPGFESLRVHIPQSVVSLPDTLR
jgi:hypothetical protein